MFEAREVAQGTWLIQCWQSKRRPACQVFCSFDLSTLGHHGHHVRMKVYMMKFYDRIEMSQLDSNSLSTLHQESSSR